MGKKSSKIGKAGELLTAKKLNEMGLIVAFPGINTPGVDILVSDGLSAKAIQVKTGNHSKTDWPCPLPKVYGKGLVYIFVNLNPKTGKGPDFYIVPSSDVYKIVKAIDDEYITKKPASANKKGVNKFRIENGKYKNRWKNLGLKIE